MSINIFTLGNNPDQFAEKKKGSVEMYRPTLDKGTGNVYKAVVRFIPFWNAKSANDMILSKRIGWITDPVTGISKYVDCPSSVGLESPLSSIYWKLNKSKRVDEQKLAEKFSTNQYFFTLIQVIEDKQQPELEGKILVWKFGRSIKNKIDLEVFPTNERTKKRVPFDLFTGRAFDLHIHKKGDWPNYDMSTFLEDEQPLIIDGKSIDRDTCDESEILKYLKENSPDLSKYSFQPWDEDTRQFVFGAITHTIPNNNVVESVVRRSTDSSPKPMKTESNFGDSGFEFGDSDDESYSISGNVDIDIDELDDIDI